MTLAALHMAARATSSAIQQMAADATKAGSAMSAAESRFQTIFKNTPQDVQDLINQYLALVDALKQAGPLADRTGLGKMEDIIGRWVRGVDFNYLRQRGSGGGMTLGGRGKTSTSTPSGSSSTSISTAIAQGKMGW